jgi:predicted secreted protein
VASASAEVALAAAAPDAGAGSGTADSGGADAGAPRPGPRVVEIDESGAGKVIELGPGQQLRATLDANPTTGFDWAVIKAPAALGTPEMGYVSSGDVPGAPGKRHLKWTLKSALPAGEHAVELGYARSFEKGVPPFKTFRFKVRAP